MIFGHWDKKDQSFHPHTRNSKKITSDQIGMEEPGKADKISSKMLMPQNEIEEDLMDANTDFETYDEAKKWFEKRSKAYGSKQKFTSSEEYRKAFPKIKKLYEEQVRIPLVQQGKIALQQSNTKIGDRVQYDYVSAWGVTPYSGTVFSKAGIPFVKLDEGQSNMGGQKSIRWHKGFKKIDSSELNKNPSEVE